MNKYRRLQVTSVGYWYIGLTIALGMVALASGNNIIYLIESFLLSGFILSGVLAEQIVSSVYVEVRRRPVIAGQRAQDLIMVRNNRSFPIFCVEIGEFKGRKFIPIAFIPSLGPKATVTVRSEQVLQVRGVHSWDGLSVATAYPFGFAKKLRFIRLPGQRLVWPSLGNRAGKSMAEDTRRSGRKLGHNFVDGEVRPMVDGDDYRMVVWTLTSKGGQALVRARRSGENLPTVVLDTRSEPGAVFEKKVSEVAAHFYLVSSDSENAESFLVIVDWSGSRRIDQHQALDQLAVVAASGISRIGRNAA